MDRSARILSRTRYIAVSGQTVRLSPPPPFSREARHARQRLFPPPFFPSLERDLANNTCNRIVSSKLLELRRRDGEK